MKPGSDHPLHKESTYLEDGRKSMILAREWLRECTRNHSTCSRRSKIVPPTRLLRIDKGKLHLCLSVDLEDCLDYATLSHCWGDANILRLLSGNLSLLLESIPYEDLSKTFGDAIEIARDMGFSFLWIDTLCIIQDDSNDWQRESVCMAMTYGMSSLNIAASAAPDGNTGCFFPRDPTELRPVKVIANINSKQMILELIDRDLVYINIDRAPLSRRAWVVQERVLAPRNLYFGVSQIFWECAQKSACETFPDMIPAELVSQDSYLPKRALWHSWDRIASTYSAGSLTYPRDKSIAIAGIARRIHEETGYTYLAGLWGNNLESQLCWMVETRKPNVHPHELRVTDMPSWSWLAVNAIVKVSLSTVLTVKLYIEVMSAVVTLDGAPILDPFGFFNGGALTIDTKYLLSCKVQSTQPLSEDSWPKRVFFAHTELVALVNWDYQDCYDPCMLLLLPVGHFDQYGGQGRILQECILLRPTGRENGQYERVGVLSVWPWSEPTDSLDTLLHDMFETPDHSDCTECILSEQDYQSVRFDDENACYTITIV
ncbi:heterokaryon incompatibility protein [Rutstroemia sp. NJR-2017a BVV2]|nr:heterokaryon incompatibility protein [Rutstroemia sp. NJR-2017a BVV2]